MQKRLTVYPKLIFDPVTNLKSDDKVETFELH